MCFSAAANFVGGGVLGTIGAVTLTKVKHRRELLFASLPILFAIHQFIEGFVWLGLDGILSPTVTHNMGAAFMLYAQGLLPFLLPLSVLLFEPTARRRRRPFRRIPGFARRSAWRVDIVIDGKTRSQPTRREGRLAARVDTVDYSNALHIRRRGFGRDGTSAKIILLPAAMRPRVQFTAADSAAPFFLSGRAARAALGTVGLDPRGCQSRLASLLFNVSFAAAMAPSGGRGRGRQVAY